MNAITSRAQTQGKPPATRLRGLGLLALLALATARLAAAGATGPADPRARALIEQAGNARDEVRRCELLREASGLPGLGAALAADLAKLLPVAEQYAALRREPTVPGDGVRGSENGYLCFFYLPIRKTKNTPADDYPPPVAAGSPLHPLHCLYRGRMLIWYAIQRGSIAQDPDLRPLWFDEGRRLLRVAHAAYPDNPVIGMYLGEPIPWPDPAPADPRAPAWANLQRTGLEKWADVVEWWIEHRQLPNGEFGGGWGDDVELWRTWPAVLLAFQEPRIEAAQERISEGIFRMPHMSGGFMARVLDAEHSAEDSSDSITPMMLIRPGDPVWRARAGRIAELMRDVWTGVNQKGQLQFKSAYIGAGGVDPDPRRAADTTYHFRTMQPALLLWLRTRDPALTSLFTPWLDTWVDACLRAEHGKPAGIPPSCLRWPEGSVGAGEQRWWKAGFYDTGLYDFPAAIDEMLPNLLLAHVVTGSERYLQPIRALAGLRLQAGEEDGNDAPAGSRAWAVARAGPALDAVLAKYRQVTGDTRYDGLILRNANAYGAYRMSGDIGPLEQALARNAAAMAANFEAYTSEVRWTDRIRAFHGKYLNLYTAEKRPAPALELLYAMASGDLGGPDHFPMNAVRWLTPPRAMAALVTAAGAGGFSADLYHFGPASRPIEAEFYQLAPGRYRVELTTRPADGTAPQCLQSTWMDVTGPVARARLELPSRTLCALAIFRP